MKFKFSVTLFLALAALAVGCAKKENHAPVCPYGQVLSYNQGNYNCAYVSMNAAYMMGGYQQSQTVNGAAMVTPPVMNCGVSNQTLINWNGTWLCYTNDVLYPDNDNSPGGVTPPPGRGGEFCTSVGMGAYAYSAYAYNPYNTGYSAMSGTSNMYVSCSPGFTCQAGTPGASPTQTTNPAYAGLGGMYGQAGTCVYSGYHGSY